MEKQHKVLAATAALVTVFVAPEAMATNGDQMLGVTATQWGMAGATTAAPQDAGTVLTNPAGLAVVEMDEFRADMGFGFLNPPRKANGVKSDSDLYMIPSGALGFRPSSKLSVGLGMAGLSGMGVDFDDIQPAPGSNNVVTTKQFFKIAPGFAYNVNDRLAVGAALNINYQSLAMDLKLMDPSGNTMEMHLPQKQVYGFGGSLGLVYRISDQFQAGASYIMKQNMEPFDWNTSSGKFEMTMDAPAQLALGVAYRAAGWLVEADIKQIQFSDVLDTVDLKTPAGVQPRPFGWDDQTVYAVGVQKDLSKKTTVRFGYNYGESPIGPEDVEANFGSLAVTEHHASFGVTQQIGAKTFGSFSYVRAFPNEVESNSTPATIELEQNVVNVQITYRN